MENLFFTGLIAIFFNLNPRDWRTWVICLGIYGGIAWLRLLLRS